MLHNLYPIILSILMLAMAPMASAKADAYEELKTTCCTAKDADSCLALLWEDECIWADEQCHVRELYEVRKLSERFDRLVVASASSGTAAIVASLFCVFWFEDPAAAMISGLAGVSWLYFGYQVNKYAMLLHDRHQRVAYAFTPKIRSQPQPSSPDDLDVAREDDGTTTHNSVSDAAL